MAGLSYKNANYIPLLQKETTTLIILFSHATVCLFPYLLCCVWSISLSLHVVQAAQKLL